MDTKSVFASKTIWLAIAQGVAGVLVVLMANPSFHPAGWLVIVKSAIDFYLRMNTTTAVSLSGN